MTTVHAKPEYQIAPLGAPPAGYPTKPQPDVYQLAPVKSTFAERKAGFIAHALKNPAPQNTKPVWYELLRMVGGEEAHEGVIHAALNFIDDRKDCADFVEHSILRLLYQFDPAQKKLNLKHPPSEELLKHAKETTLGFKYWPDEPGLDSMCTWTENHYILFSSAGYLAGQLYPDEVFVNSGETGREKMARNRPRILRWLDMHFRTGFNEWLSHVYYDEDLTALLSLYDFCEDEEIRTKAEMVLDLILLDMALNSFKGVFGSTHGRAYENTKKWASNEGTSDSMKLLFGMGIYSAFDSMSAGGFALSTYNMPPAIEAIAHDTDKTYINRQRMGFKVQDAEKWGLTYDDTESGMVFLTNEAYLHPLTAELTLKMFDEFNWWESEFFHEFPPYRGFLNATKKLNLIPTLAKVLEKDVCRNMRDEPNVYTYHTADYMLSTAQSHRAGYGGDQQHIWQATLGPDAVCFTTHPARIHGVSPDYWAGSGILPRAAQYKNLTISVYNIKRLIPALYVPTKLFFTHAWLPKDKFDEVIEKNGWIFARKDDGYLALRSQNPYFWNTEGEQEKHNFTFGNFAEDMDREIIADGAQNIWICQLGRKEDDGRFEQFVEAISLAEVVYNGQNIEYRAPGIGQVRFGWEGALSVDGKEIQLDHYPRYDNPYVQADFDTTKIQVKAGEHVLDLDWETGKRSIA